MSKKHILIIAVLHLVITLGGIMFTFDAGMDRFDSFEEPTFIEQSFEYITLALMSPLYWLWTSSMSRNIHDSIEWLLFLLNSGLWGLVIEYIYSKIKLFKRKNSPS